LLIIIAELLGLYPKQKVLNPLFFQPSLSDKLRWSHFKNYLETGRRAAVIEALLTLHLEYNAKRYEKASMFEHVFFQPQQLHCRPVQYRVSRAAGERTDSNKKLEQLQIYCKKVYI